MLPNIGNEEYQYRFSKRQEDTLCSGGGKCKKQPSDSSRIRILLDLVGKNRPGVEHSSRRIRSPLLARIFRNLPLKFL